MHKAETHLTTNTAYFASKVLSNCEIAVRGVQDSPIEFDKLVDKKQFTPLYLFPDEDAKELSPEFLDSLELPPYIIVPDGSWKQAKKFKKREPFLKELQSVKLPPGELSNYRLRTNPFPEAVCTYEAVARALGVCDSMEIQKSLEDTFEVITDRMFYSRQGLSNLDHLSKFKD
jgi:DTW domain-containing protein YfiP